MNKNGCEEVQLRASSWKLIVQIFYTFIKISPVTFGGGYAMIPLIKREIVDRRHWLRNEEMSDIFAVSESVPGAIAINSATFTGFRLAGVRGAIAALIGILLPTLCIVITLSIVYFKFQHHPKVEAAFMAIRATIVALIAYAAIVIGKTALVDKASFVITAVTIAVMYWFNVHPIILLIGGGMAGVIVIAIKRKLGMTIVFKRKRKAKQTEETSFEDEADDHFIGHGI